MKYPTLQEAALVAAGSLLTAYVVKKFPVVGAFCAVPAVALVAYTAAQNRPADGYKLIKG